MWTKKKEKKKKEENDSEEEKEEKKMLLCLIHSLKRKMFTMMIKPLNNQQLSYVY